MRHPWSRDRRRDNRGARWDTLAERLRQAGAPCQAAQERAGEAQPVGGADASDVAQRAAGAKR